ncbi:MAG: hypothetical protein FWG17_07270 [Desulfovibrionaceae bacterium]|nr:hypothetical protein [Desulfovibrionaceae bacterium]
MAMFVMGNVIMDADKKEFAALEGRKLEVLRANPRTQLCLIAEAYLLRKGKPCACTMHYRSVLVDGRAEILPPRRG